MLEAVHVLIADILQKPEWQMRTGLVRSKVLEYRALMREGDMDPIRLARVNGALMGPVDGWHRLNAALLLDRTTILATVEDMSLEQAQLAAWAANEKHGLPLDRA